MTKPPWEKNSISTTTAWLEGIENPPESTTTQIMDLKTEEIIWVINRHGTSIEPTHREQ